MTKNKWRAENRYGLDPAIGEDDFRMFTLNRPEEYPEEFQDRWWYVYDPEDDTRVRELFYPVVMAAMDVADSYARSRGDIVIAESEI